MDTYLQIKSILNKVSYFTDEHAQQFYEALTIKRIRKGGLLLRAGQVCDFIAIVLNGSLRAYRQDGEKEHTLGFFTEDCWAADHHSFVSQQTSQNYISTMEPTQVAIISISSAHQLIAKDQRFIVLLRVLDQWTPPSDLSIHNTSPQDRYDMLMQQHPEWIIRFPQKYLSSYLGITPETFSRVKRRNLFS